MKKSSSVSSVLTVFALALTLSAGASSQSPEITGAHPDRVRSLDAFLRDYVRTKHFPGEDDTRYASAFIDLSGDHNDEAIVFMVGRWWCGTGGCATMVLTPEGVSWRLVATVVTTDTPISVLEKRSRGWRGVTVWTRNPGFPAYEAELKFDGRAYPMKPVVPVQKQPKGKVVISSEASLRPLH